MLTLDYDFKFKTFPPNRKTSRRRQPRALYALFILETTCWLRLVHLRMCIDWLPRLFRDFPRGWITERDASQLSELSSFRALHLIPSLALNSMQKINSPTSRKANYRVEMQQTGFSTHIFHDCTRVCCFFSLSPLVFVTLRQSARRCGNSAADSYLFYQPNTAFNYNEAWDCARLLITEIQRKHSLYNFFMHRLGRQSELNFPESATTKTQTHEAQATF